MSHAPPREALDGSRRLFPGRCGAARATRLLGADTRVARDVGLSTEEVDQAHVFVRVEAVRLRHATPIGVDLPRPPRSRSNSRAVMLVGEAFACPAHTGTCNPLGALTR